MKNVYTQTRGYGLTSEAMLSGSEIRPKTQKQRIHRGTGVEEEKEKEGKPGG